MKQEVITVIKSIIIKDDFIIILISKLYERMKLSDGLKLCVNNAKEYVQNRFIGDDRSPIKR